MAAPESETEAQQLVSRLGKQLKASKSCPNKDSLVKLLKEAVSALGKLKQLKSLNSIIQPLSDSLIRHGLLQHKDKDIKILVATCFCEIIRVLAPDPGFSDDVFRDIFKLLQSIFAEIGDYTSPYFLRRVKLLETVAKLNFCVLMLDIGCEDLILKMFKIFFSVVREQHPHSVITAMSTIITRVLEDKLEENDLEPLIFQKKFSEPLLDVILQNLLRESKGASAGLAQLAVSVLNNCNEKLERCICTFLRSCILKRDIIGSELKESYHEILYEIFRSAPEMLVSVIPSLSHELLTDQVDVRIKALNLIRKFFALPGHNIAQEYRNLFVEFLNRFTDKSSEVRLCAISCGKAFYTYNPSGTGSSEVLKGLESRLLDFDDRVRLQAVTVVCDLARSKINSVTNELISRVAERLRDKKVSVRKKALQKLLELYQDYCTKCVEGILKLSDHFEQIPCRILMLCYDKDCKEIRPQSLEYILAEDVFPVSLSVEERTKHWIFMFSLFTPLHLKALNTILSQKRRFRDALQAYLHLQVKEQEIGSDEMERRTKALFIKMSAFFPDPAEAEECFHKLKQAKDNDIFKMLADLLNVGDAHSTRDNILRNIGDQNPLFEFLGLLSSKCLLNIFNSGHVCSILDHLTVGERVGNMYLEGSSVQLLLTIISAFPSLLRSCEKKFLLLLAEDIIPFNEQLIQLLAKEGSNISIKLSDLYYFLERVCLEGTRAQAKLAVSAIAALSCSSAQVIFSNLCKMLVDSLHLGQNIPTVLQSLGCIAQHSVSAFEAHEKEISHYILEEIFPVSNVNKSNEINLFDQTSECCKSCKLKIFALKMLVRSFLPHDHVHVNRNIGYLLDVILQMLQTGSFSDGTNQCHSDTVNIRLAAAKSVLRLSRKWDMHISPLVYRLTMLVAKDQRLLAHRLFVNKVHKLVKQHAIPSRYACVFSFVALDASEDLRDNSLIYMREYISIYGKAAGIYKNCSSLGRSTDHPAYMIVFLIHILAHDTDFPTMESRDEEMYIRSTSPLLFSLQALLDTNFFDGDLEVINCTAAYLRSIFHAIKRAEDAIDAQMTPKLHMLADFGISIMNSLECTNVSGSGNPELVLLPSSLYKMGVAERREASKASLPFEKHASLIRTLTRSFGIQTSQTSCSIKKHSEQRFKNSLTTDADKSTKSNLTLCKSADTSRFGIKNQSNKPYSYQKELYVTSNQEDHSGGTVELHNEFSVDDQQEIYASVSFETVIRNERLGSSCDSVATKPTLGPNKDSPSCLCEREVNMMDNRNTANITKLSTTNLDKVNISKESKDKGESSVVEHLELQFSTDNSEKEISGACDSDSKRNSFKKTKLCGKEIPLLENRKKVQRSKIAASKTIDVNEDIIARRTRRRKV
ncbi:hypothetical protein ACH5RR_026341 [Cinchona calisaya]|uniref:Sister chromatid cohesion protein PDS5 homolog A n=1 Tax=Cinchona calisaya TaxID=153742 RepID=A0ABD2Z4F7_9GENT